MTKIISEIITKELLKTPNEICFAKKKYGEWITYNKKEYLDIAENIAFALLEKGVKKGDNIIIASENRPEWNFVDLALLKIGAVSIPVYATISDEQLEIIIKETETKIVFVSNKYLNRKVKTIANKLGIIIKTYSFENIEEEESIHKLANFGKNYQNKNKLEEIAKNIDENDIYSILYTSGTSLAPYGVMLSHKSQIITIKNGINRLNILNKYKTILYIPLNNIFGRTMNYIAQILGMAIYYTNGISKLEKHIFEIKPNFLATVPIFLEKIIISTIQKRSELNKSCNILGEIKTILVGGAIFNKNTFNFYKNQNIKILNVYGLTETSGIISMDTYNKIAKPDYCGTAIPEIKIKISDEGEILAKGDNLMSGYYKHPEITAETIDKDGWLHTGDIGELDKDGYLAIKGRLKSTFKLISGEYVYPETIEGKLMKYSYIANVIVAGLAKEYIVALIVPNFDAIRKWAKNNYINIETNEEIVENTDVINLFSNIFKQYNSILMGAKQRVEKFKLITDTWSVKTNETTPTMKINRNYILEKYRNEIEELYLEN